MEDYQYSTPKQIVKSGRYPFSLGQIRHLLLFRNKNGLNFCVRKVGKRLILRMDLFEKWLEAQKEVHNG